LPSVEVSRSKCMSGTPYEHNLQVRESLRSLDVILEDRKSLKSIYLVLGWSVFHFVTAAYVTSRSQIRHFPRSRRRKFQRCPCLLSNQRFSSYKWLTRLKIKSVWLLWIWREFLKSSIIEINSDPLKSTSMKHFNFHLSEGKYSCEIVFKRLEYSRDYTTFFKKEFGW